MNLGKGAYLRDITSSMNMKSVDVGRKLDGTTPPSVFVGSWNYPKVYAGPMIAPVIGECSFMDTPEEWIPGQMTQEQIIGYRLSLVRGKHPVSVSSLDDRFVGKLQEIALSEGSVPSNAGFLQTPAGYSFSDEHTPHGPSAPLESLDIGNSSFERNLEKVYNDTDLTASDAIVDLHRKGVMFSSIQKALSAGTMGIGKRRRLVPTRWSITACDTMIGNRLLSQVREFEPIDCWKVHEFSSLNNHYAILLMPTGWQYEWTEAFLRIIGNEEMVFSDYELHTGKKEYSRVGGCFYSCRMAVLEALARQKLQAGAIVLREARKGYIPLGVFNVRENVRNALLQRPLEFEDMRSALDHISLKMTLPLQRFVTEGTLIGDMMHSRQATLQDFSA
jgi:hypothetical protein